MAWEPPFEYEVSRGILEVLIEMNAKLAQIGGHVAQIADLLSEDDGEEEEETDG
jgi:hypothetical protein